MNIRGGFKYLILVLVIFSLGWISSNVFAVNLNAESPFSLGSNELKSPADWISQEQIKIYSDKIVIDIANATWAQFADTNSMDPVLDKGANSIQLIPSSSDELSVGDIISYEAGFTKGVVVHRIVSMGSDENGWYAIVKGDNNKSVDPERVRFNQVKRVLIGILY